MSIDDGENEGMEPGHGAALETGFDEAPFTGGQSAIRLDRPPLQTLPIVFASPHSGRNYPEQLLVDTRLDPLTLRSSEDAWIDRLFALAPAVGAPLLQALFPRVWLDPNRAAWELDPAMFRDRLPSWVTIRNARIAAGLGTVPKVVANGQTVYGRRLDFAEAEARVATCHRPYHQALEDLTYQTRERFGAVLLVDCHSMPSGAVPASNGPVPDIILGDRHGSSCDPDVTAWLELAFRDLGYRVRRNAPYAGGYTTRHYGRPNDDCHAVQIEINRALYMNEYMIEPTAGFTTLKADIERLLRNISDIVPAFVPDSDPVREAAE